MATTPAAKTARLSLALAFLTQSFLIVSAVVRLLYHTPSMRIRSALICGICALLGLLNVGCQTQEATPPPARAVAPATWEDFSIMCWDGLRSGSAMFDHPH